MMTDEWSADNGSRQKFASGTKPTSKGHRMDAAGGAKG